MVTAYYISTLSTGISRIPTTVSWDYLMITSDMEMDVQKNYARYGIIDSSEIIEATGRTNVEISMNGIVKSRLETGDVSTIDLLMSLYLAEQTVYLYESHGTTTSTKVTLGATGFSTLTPSCYKITDFGYSKKPGNEALLYFHLTLLEIVEA